ncbi:MAG TPA: hypothetical protein VEQ60_13875, partial [Longimicrobium sp.]|nr:hypothetical protein [Longimicrobium sp.]
LHDLCVVSTYTGHFHEAEQHAAEAFAAYGADHPDLINLAFDVSHFWKQQGQFARALEVLKALHGRFPDADRQLRVLASTARAAGAMGEADTFHRAWTDAWRLIDGESVDHLRAAAPLELGLGALSLGLWEYAEHALTTARDAANELREGETLAQAEASLDHLKRRHAADCSRQPPMIATRTRSGDLAAALVSSLNAQVSAPARASASEN